MKITFKTTKRNFEQECETMRKKKEENDKNVRIKQERKSNEKKVNFSGTELQL